MCRSMVDIQSAAAEIRRGKKRKKKSERRTNHSMKIYMVVDNCVCSAAGIEQLQLIAKKSGLIVIPLIQTFGHFEVFFFVPFV